MTEFQFDEVGECERCRLEKPICRTGVCEGCLTEMLALREVPEYKGFRDKRLRDLNSAENAILRNVRSQMALQTHQSNPQRGISFPKILKARDIQRAQRAHEEEILEKLVFTSRERFSEASLLVKAIVEPYDKTKEGDLVRAVALPWRAILERLKKDWTQAFKIPARVWEEIIAAAFDQDGYEEVTLTPRSGDHGRDVIAVKRGIGCIRIIDSVKAYAPNHLVRYDDVRALAGVLLGDPQASKGILTTTSDFAPGIINDPIMAPLMPYRLELMNGTKLLQWFEDLTK